MYICIYIYIHIYIRTQTHTHTCTSTVKKTEQAETWILLPRPACTSASFSASSAFTRFRIRSYTSCESTGVNEFSMHRRVNPSPRRGVNQYINRVNPRSGSFSASSALTRSRFRSYTSCELTGVNEFSMQNQYTYKL